MFGQVLHSFKAPGSFHDNLDVLYIFATTGTKGSTMRLSVLVPSILLSILFSTTPVRCTVDLDFSAYPTSAQTCLEDAAGISGCSGDTISEINKCLCGNTGNFVLNAATCIGSQGDQVLESVWSLLQDSCSNTKTPLDVSEAQFLASGTETKVTSTITTTRSAGVLTTFTTTSTSTHSSGATTATSTSTSTASSTASNNADVVASAKIGAITASVAGTLFIVCVVCLIVLLKKHKQDKELLRRAQEAAAYGDRNKGPDKPLLNPGDVTPGFPGPGGAQYNQTFGPIVAPPTPSYAGPISPQVWRLWPQQAGQGPTTSPSELSSDQNAIGLNDDLANGQPAHWPSPLTQGVGTMGTWCPSPLSAIPSSNVLGMYNGGTGTIGTLSAISSPLSRQITGTTTTSRSSWAHNRPQPDELYELPGDEVRTPVEADSIPVLRTSERLSMAISQAPPPEYYAGGWNDPITDKPPTWI